MRKEIGDIQEQYGQLNRNYQEVFSKLHLYSQQFNQAQNAKLEYQQILEELKKAEEDIQADKEAEIVKLRLTNSHLHQGMAEAMAQKQQILALVNDILVSKQEGQQDRGQNYENSYQHILKALQDIKLRCESIMAEPMQFLSLKF